MKFFNIFLLEIFLFTSGCILSKNNSTFVKTNTVLNDTFFLKLEYRKGNLYHSIFIDSTKNSIYLKHLYGFNYQDSINLNDFSARAKKNSIVLDRKNTYGLSSEWLPVFQYNSKYYLYKPSDIGSRKSRVITDSLVMFYSMDGYIPLVLQSCKKMGDNSYNFLLISSIEDTAKKTDELNIYIIDQKSMLSVWEHKSQTDSKYSYQLMLPKKQAEYFPIIVNTSNFSKQPEFDFQEIKYGELLKPFKN